MRAPLQSHYKFRQRGFAFGGGCFYGHGVRVSGGSPRLSSDKAGSLFLPRSRTQATTVLIEELDANGRPNPMLCGHSGMHCETLRARCGRHQQNAEFAASINDIVLPRSVCCRALMQLAQKAFVCCNNLTFFLNS
jgi:hypothetical protein